MGRRLLRILRWSALAVLGLLLVAAAAFGLMQTPWGKTRALQWVAGRVAPTDGQRIELSGLEGFFPSDLRLGSISFQDMDGPWLTCEDLRLKWSPWTLMRGKVQVEEFGAGRVHWDRRPRVEKKPGSGAGFPRLPEFKVEQLSFERVEIGQEVLGQSAVFRITGRMTGDAAGLKQRAEFLVERTDGPRAEAVWKVEFAGEDRSIVAELDVTEAAGGLAARALGLDGPLSLQLQGQGPPGEWKGVLSFGAGAMGRVDTDVLLSYGREPRLEVHGRIEHGRASPLKPWIRWLGAETAFHASGRVQGESALLLESFKVTGDGVEFELEGALDRRGGKVEGRFALHCNDFSGLAPVPTAGRGAVTGHFSGPLRQPRIRLNTRLQEVQAGRVVLSHFEGQFEVGLLRPFGEGFGGLEVDGEGTAAGVTVGGWPAMPEPTVGWRISARGPSEGRVEISRWEMSGKQNTLEASGHVAVPKLGGDLVLRVHSQDLRPWRGWVGGNLPLSGRLEAHVKGEVETGTLEVRLAGDMSLLEANHPVLQPFQGETVTLHALASMGRGAPLMVRELALKAPKAELRGEADIDLMRRTIACSWQIVVPETKPFSAAISTPLEGALRLSGRLDGPLDRPKMDVVLNSGSLSVRGIRLDELTVSAWAAGWPPQEFGTLSMAGVRHGEAFQVDAGYQWKAERLQFTAVKMTGLRSSLTGGLDLDPRNRSFEGRFKGRCRDLAGWGKWLGTPLKGEADLEVRLQSGNRLATVNLTLDGKDLKTPYGSTERLNVQGKLQGTLSKPEGELVLALHGARRGDWSLSKLDMAAKVEGSRLHFNAKGKGHFSESFDGTATGYVQRTGTKVDGALERFSGQFAGTPFALTKPAKFLRTPNAWSMEPFTVRTAGGTATASVNFGPDQQKMTLRFSDVQLERLPMPIMDKTQGKAQGEVILQGSGGATQGEFALGVDALRFRGTSFPDTPAAALSARGKLETDGLHVSLTLRGPTERPLAGELTLPMHLSLMPFRWALPRDGALRGHLEGNVRLEQLMELAGVDDQELKGRLDGRFELAGTLNSPTVRGRAQVKNGRYENFHSGTLLEGLNLTVRGAPEGLTIEEAAASDGGVGKITAAGELAFSSAGGYRLNLDVKVAQANLLRHDYADATVSGGLTLRGNLKRPLLAGRLEVGPAEFRIPKRLPTGLSELEVVKVGAEAGQTGSTGSKKPTPTTTLAMDVGIVIPGRVFVRGKGLESEWKGNLTVGGNAATPILTGGLSVVRGHFDLLGKRFSLRDGRIDFAGQSPPEPTIDVRAEAKTRELTARVQLTGFAREPQIVLSSDPALPQEEVLSHLLFGRSIQKITPIQAVRLGQAAAALTGGGGLDPLGRARTLLGVDRLDVKQQDDDPNAVAVSAGKYLSDKVYVEVERGATEDSGKVSMELELTPNLSVETEVGTNAQGGVGLNWRWDY